MERPNNRREHYVRVNATGSSSKSTNENIISLDANPEERDQQQQQNSHWPFLLLLCSLLMSIGNTLLLSSVFKSLQTSDEMSNVESKIGWDETSLSNLVQPPIELLGDAKLKLNSLERVSQLPLELVVQFETQEHGDAVQTIKFIEQTGGGYFALNLNDTTHDELMSSEQKLRKTLELGTRMLVINKINKINKQSSGPIYGSNNDYKQKSIHHNPNNNESMINTGDKKREDTIAQGVSKLLELDTQEASVTLPMQKQLTTSNDIHEPMQIRVDEKLSCPHLHGSIENNLDLQARGSDLVCQANDALLAQSKSGDAKLSFYEDIRLEAPELELDARDVYIPKGLSYLETQADTMPPPPTQEKQQQQQDNSNNLEGEQSGAEEDCYEALELVSIGDQLATAESSSQE